MKVFTITVVCALLFFYGYAQKLNTGSGTLDHPGVADSAKPEERVSNYRVISEKKDKQGRTIRKVQFTKGNALVTQTLILPPSPGLGVKIPIDPDTLNRDSMMVYIDKTNYLVALIYKRKRIRQYKAVFGPDRLRDKMMEGDRSTPEGWFKISAKKNHRDWQRFILLNYPNDTSYQRFRQRKAQGLIPQSARIGNSIGIHGTEREQAEIVDMGVGWTDGCIALKPEDIEDLYQFVWPGTRVYVKR